MRKRLARSDDEDSKLAAKLEDLRKSAEVHMEKRVQITIDGSGLESQLEDFMIDLLKKIEVRCDVDILTQEKDVSDRGKPPVGLETNRFRELFKSMKKNIENTGKAMKSLCKRLFEHQ